jgi:hypothetical protein
VLFAEGITVSLRSHFVLERVKNSLVLELSSDLFG